MKRSTRAGFAVLLAAPLAGCAQEAAPPVIINNIPPGDSGLPVVVTVLAIALVAAVGFAVLFWSKLGRAVEDKVKAENVVAALTGMTPDAFRLAQILGAAGIPDQAGVQRTHPIIDQPMLDHRRR